MSSLSMREQAVAITRKYERAETVMLAGWGALWYVVVQPADMRYRISILYLRGGDLGGCLLLPTLRVTVVDPTIARRPDAPDDPIPHVYCEGPPVELCLYDPGVEATTSEWDPTMPIADTLIPWASEWLYFYELWRVTGVWCGREVRH